MTGVPASSHGSAVAGLTSLFSSTLGAPAASIDTGAGGIAAGHGVLMIWVYGRTSGAGTDVGCNMIVNNDSSAIYDAQQLSVTNLTVSAGPAQAQTSWGLDMIGTNASDSYASTVMLTLPNYDQTTFWKSGTAYIAVPYSQSTVQHLFGYSIGYRATTAISRLKITATAGNLAAGTSLLIFGTQ